MAVYQAGHLKKYCKHIYFLYLYLIAEYSYTVCQAPEFSEMSVEQEILVTGIKVVDLLAPYAKGGKIGKLIFFNLVDCPINLNFD